MISHAILSRCCCVHRRAGQPRRPCHGTNNTGAAFFGSLPPQHVEKLVLRCVSHMDYVLAMCIGAFVVEILWQLKGCLFGSALQINDGALVLKCDVSSLRAGPLVWSGTPGVCLCLEVFPVLLLILALA